jgi:hypothetical protein
VSIGVISIACKNAKKIRSIRIMITLAIARAVDILMTLMAMHRSIASR